MKARLWSIALVAGLLGFVPSAHAIPTLQIYVEGAVYDGATQTWIGTPDVNDLLHVWVIGSDDGLGGGPGDLVDLRVTDLRLSVLFGAASGPIVLTAAETIFGGFFDSWPREGVVVGDDMTQTADIVTDAGSQGPTVTIGLPVGDYLPIIDAFGIATGPDELASHGEFRAGRLWQQYELPDIDFLAGNLTNIADFAGIAGSDTIPGPDPLKFGVIYAFTIDTSAFEDLSWHFDAYGLLSETREVCTDRDKGVCVETTETTSVSSEFAPFSHDGGGVDRKIPEPLTLALFGAGLIGLGALRRRFAA